MCPRNSPVPGIAHENRGEIGNVSPELPKVCINEYDISKETDDDDAIWWTDDDGHLKDYRDATYDGFGNTIQKPFGIRHV